MYPAAVPAPPTSQSCAQAVVETPVSQASPAVETPSFSLSFPACPSAETPSGRLVAKVTVADRLEQIEYIARAFRKDFASNVHHTSKMKDIVEIVSEHDVP